MRSSYLWAGAFCLAIAGWFVSGNMEAIGITPPPSEQPEVKEKIEAKDELSKLFKVEVRRFTAKPKPSFVTVRGRTEKKKQVTVRARTAGIVETTAVEEGDRVKAGDLLCRLDMQDRKAKLARAKAQLASAQRDYEAARKLEKAKYVSAAKLASELARLDAAKAAIEQIELDINWTNITSPVTGVITKLDGEQGSFLQPGQPCATVSVFNPLLATVQVSEVDIANIKLGQKAVVRPVTGETVTGKVTFISPSADVATRTFRVEVEIDNKDNRLKDGLTSAVTFALPPLKAHLLPAGIVGLDDNGKIVVRTLDSENKVRSIPVKLVAQTRDGAWVIGLPDTIDVISAGQDYVLDGQLVDPHRHGEGKKPGKTS